MEISIESKHHDMTDEQMAYIREKVGHLEHYFGKIIVAEVFMHGQSGNHEIELRLNVPNDILFVKQTGSSVSGAVDMAVDTMKKAIIKYKEKMSPRN